MADRRADKNVPADHSDADEPQDRRRFVKASLAAAGAGVLAAACSEAKAGIMPPDPDEEAGRNAVDWKESVPATNHLRVNCGRCEHLDEAGTGCKLTKLSTTARSGCGIGTPTGALRLVEAGLGFKRKLKRRLEHTTGSCDNCLFQEDGECPRFAMFVKANFIDQMSPEGGELLTRRFTVDHTTTCGKQRLRRDARADFNEKYAYGEAVGHDIPCSICESNLEGECRQIVRLAVKRRSNIESAIMGEYKCLLGRKKI